MNYLIARNFAYIALGLNLLIAFVIFLFLGAAAAVPVAVALCAITFVTLIFLKKISKAAKNGSGQTKKI